MRIVITNWSSRKAGGAEHYLDVVIPKLEQAGHEVALLCEMDFPADRPRIRGDSATLWTVGKEGIEGALAQIRQWKPDLIYGHGFRNVEVELRALDLAPGVFFAHNYYGTCISGDKTFKFPNIRPCERHFGWQCLAQYYPRRCGGLNPLTMWNMYSSQTRRLALLHRYKLLITASEHMRREYLRYGFAPAAVRTTMSPIDCGHSSGDESCGRAGDTGEVADNSYAHTYAKHAEIRLLFAGRMERLKGGVLLIDALSQVASALGRPVRLILAGDGTDRRAWAEHARFVCARDPTVEANFIGWSGAAKLEGLAKACDLLVVPSLWPEPFGRVGLEFGFNGLPVAAFAVGGIPEWLTCGVNGYLAPADPPTSFGLAEAIVRCLRDPAEHARLRTGAVEIAKRFCVDRHTAELHDIFSEIAAEAT